MKIDHYHKLGVYKSILPKMLTIALELKISIIGDLKVSESQYDYEDTFWPIIHSLHVDLAKTVNFGLWAQAITTMSRFMIHTKWVGSKSIRDLSQEKKLELRFLTKILGSLTPRSYLVFKHSLTRSPIFLNSLPHTRVVMRGTLQAQSSLIYKLSWVII